MPPTVDKNLFLPLYLQTLLLISFCFFTDYSFTNTTSHEQIVHSLPRAYPGLYSYTATHFPVFKLVISPATTSACAFVFVRPPATGSFETILIAFRRSCAALRTCSILHGNTLPRSMGWCRRVNAALFSRFRCLMLHRREPRFRNVGAGYFFMQTRLQFGGLVAKEIMRTK